MKKFEVLIEKTAVIEVMAENENDAYDRAKDVLDGRRLGYSEYMNDGWEVLPEFIHEVQSNET